MKNKKQMTEKKSISLLCAFDGRHRWLYHGDHHTHCRILFGDHNIKCLGAVI